MFIFNTMGQQNGKAMVIGIAGGSASGKSTIAEAMHGFLKNIGISSAIICLDWFYTELTDPAQGPTHNWDEPGAFDWEEIIDAVSILKKGKAIGVPRHDYVNYKKILNYERIEPVSVIIVEGLYTLYDVRLIALLDKKMFVNCPKDISLLRRLSRDIASRGYSFEDISSRYLSHVRPSYIKWIRPSADKADVIFDNGNLNGETLRATLGALIAQNTT